MWGYGCCHSVIHLSYCSGQAGIDAANASSAQHLLSSSSSMAMPAPSKSVAEPPQDAEDRRRQAQQAFSKDRLGEGELKLNETRLAEAIREEKKRKPKGDESGDRSGKRKKGEDSHEVSEEQLGLSLLCLAGFISALIRIFRGIQDESTQSRRSNGQLCGHRTVIVVYLGLILLHECIICLALDSFSRY